MSQRNNARPEGGKTIFTSKRTALTIFIWFVAAISLTALTSFAPSVARAEDFSDNAFRRLWATTDADVAAGKVSRGLFWGPAPFAHTSEAYQDAPGGQRKVQYFDKSRMEINNPGGNPNDRFYVTNGLLTVELVTGKLQVADNTSLNRKPAEIPAAGDNDGNDKCPTYASFAKLVTLDPTQNRAPNKSGQGPLTDAIDRAGQVSPLSNPPAAVSFSTYINETGHNIAAPLWDFLNRAPLSGNDWVGVMGFPVSEPFWAKDGVTVGGQRKDVLIQLFQRRILTFTPSNSDPFKVEMGNIGQHYYRWRYNATGTLSGSYRILIEEGTGRNRDLVITQPDGKNRTVLNPNGPKLNVPGAVASPDGRNALYLSQDERGSSLYNVGLLGQNGPTRYDVAEGLNVTAFSWAKDSSRLAFGGQIPDGSGSAVYEGGAGGGTGVRLLRARRPVQSVEYGAGGQRVLITLEGGQIYVATPGAADSAQQVGNVGGTDSVRYSLTTNEAYYNDQSGIKIVNLDTKASRTVGEPAGLGRFVSGPVLSPANDLVLYADVPSGGSNGQVVIKMVDLASNQTMPIANYITNSAANLTLRFNQDGTRILLGYSDENGKPQARLFNWNGSNAVNVANLLGVNAPNSLILDPNFDLPSGLVAIVDGQIRAVNLDGGQLAPFANPLAARAILVRDARA